MELLVQTITNRSKVSAAGFATRPEWQFLFDLGFVKSAGVVQSLTCLNCDDPHDAAIVHQSGQYGYFCPDLGFVEVTPSEIEAVEADLAQIVAALADVLDCKARKTKSILGETWRVGRVSTDTGDIAIYLRPTMQTEVDTDEMRSALAVETRSTYCLILTGKGGLKLAGTAMVEIADMFEFDASGFKLAMDLRDIVGTPRRNPGGRPNRFEKPLYDLIRRRKISGKTLDGRNAEADAVLSDFIRENPDLTPPSTSAVREYVTKFRSEQ